MITDIEVFISFGSLSKSFHLRDTAGVDTLADCDSALSKLLKATLAHESAVAERDSEILLVQKKYATRIEKASFLKATLEAEIEQFYRQNCETLAPAGQKSLQLASGNIGLRAPTNPALVPLSDKWTWEKISATVKKVWKKRYFHAPKPPGLDKVALKKSLTPAQLAKLGLKLDDTENFYLELNRLAVTEECLGEAAA
jgi:Bacteriophage Mu Gam like protein